MTDAGAEAVQDEVRAAAHQIVERLPPRRQKAFLVAISAPEIALLPRDEITQMVQVLGPQHL